MSQGTLSGCTYAQMSLGCCHLLIISQNWFFLNWRSIIGQNQRLNLKWEWTAKLKPNLHFHTGHWRRGSGDILCEPDVRWARVRSAGQRGRAEHQERTERGGDHHQAERQCQRHPWTRCNQGIIIKRKLFFSSSFLCRGMAICTTPSKLVVYKPVGAERATDRTIAQACSFVPFHRSAWCHNNFALRSSVDLRDLITH